MQAFCKFCKYTEIAIQKLSIEVLEIPRKVWKCKQLSHHGPLALGHSCSRLEKTFKKALVGIQSPLATTWHAPVDPCGCPMSSALLKVEAWPSAKCYTSAGCWTPSVGVWHQKQSLGSIEAEVAFYVFTFILNPQNGRKNKNK